VLVEGPEQAAAHSDDPFPNRMILTA